MYLCRNNRRPRLQPLRQPVSGTRVTIPVLVTILFTNNTVTIASFVVLSDIFHILPILLLVVLRQEMLLLLLSPPSHITTTTEGIPLPLKTAIIIVQKPVTHHSAAPQPCGAALQQRAAACIRRVRCAVRRVRTTPTCRHTMSSLLLVALLGVQEKSFGKVTSR